jgi:hypothetical protein
MPHLDASALENDPNGTAFLHSILSGAQVPLVTPSIPISLEASTAAPAEQTGLTQGNATSVATGTIIRIEQSARYMFIELICRKAHASTC